MIPVRVVLPIGAIPEVHEGVHLSQPSGRLREAEEEQCGDDQHLLDVHVHDNEGGLTNSPLINLLHEVRLARGGLGLVRGQQPKP